MQTFGEFIKKKRIDLGISRDHLAHRVGLAEMHIEDMEKGEFHAPKREHLIRMARVLKLDENDKELMLKLAEKSKEEYKRIAATPILDYIDGNESVRDALKIARAFGATNEDWKEFGEKIKKRKTGHELE